MKGLMRGFTKHQAKAAALKVMEDKARRGKPVMAKSQKRLASPSAKRRA